MGLQCVCVYVVIAIVVMLAFVVDELYILYSR